MPETEYDAAATTKAILGMHEKMRPAVDTFLEQRERIYRRILWMRRHLILTSYFFCITALALHSLRVLWRIPPRVRVWWSSRVTEAKAVDDPEKWYRDTQWTPLIGIGLVGLLIAGPTKLRKWKSDL